MTCLIFRGTLRARTAIHPGAGLGEGVADKAVRRDASGDLLIPGTAIAGVLRGLATRLAPDLGMDPCKAIQQQPDTEHPCGCPVCDLFGEIYPDADNGASGAASRLLFSHAKAELPDGATTTVRDGVGIGRRSGTSASDAAAKFDYEVIPAGTSFQLRIEWDRGHAIGMDQGHAMLLAACIEEWRRGRIWLGAAAARGLGALALEDLTVMRRDLSKPDHLMAFLRNHAGGSEEDCPGWLDNHVRDARQRRVDKEVCTDGALRTFAHLRFTLRFDAQVLFHDHAMAVRTGFDHAPLVELSRDARCLVLPGASLRGVLRSQAERIARTLTTLDVEGLDEFGARCPCCDPNARPACADATGTPLAACASLAEAAAQRAVSNREKKPEVKPGDLCLGCQLFGSTRFGSRLRVEGGSSALPDEDPTQMRDFVAIDRFTGGAKHQAKFDALVANGQPEFQVSLSLENPEEWELGWLYLALRDLVEGMASLGFGGAKGFGRATFVDATLTLGRIASKEDFGVPTECFRDPDVLFDTARFRWNDADERRTFAAPLQQWVDAFRARCIDIGGKTAFRRGDAYRLSGDHYFRPIDHGKPSLAELYPKVWKPATTLEQS